MLVALDGPDPKILFAVAAGLQKYTHGDYAERFLQGEDAWRFVPSSLVLDTNIVRGTGIDQILCAWVGTWVTPFLGDHVSMWAYEWRYGRAFQALGQRAMILSGDAEKDVPYIAHAQNFLWNTYTDVGTPEYIAEQILDSLAVQGFRYWPPTFAGRVDSPVIIIGERGNRGHAGEETEYRLPPTNANSENWARSFPPSLLFRVSYADRAAVPLSVVRGIPVSIALTEGAERWLSTHVQHPEIHRVEGPQHWANQRNKDKAKILMMAKLQTTMMIERGLRT